MATMDMVTGKLAPGQWKISGTSVELVQSMENAIIANYRKVC